MEQYFNKTNKDWRLGLCCQFHDKDLATKFNANATTKTYFLKENSYFSKEDSYFLKENRMCL